jgi:hypothetical protein
LDLGYVLRARRISVFDRPPVAPRDLLEPNPHDLRRIVRQVIHAIVRRDGDLAAKRLFRETLPRSLPVLQAGPLARVVDGGRLRGRNLRAGRRYDREHRDDERDHVER